MTYEDLQLKKPKEAADYRDCSDFVIEQIESIMQRVPNDLRQKDVRAEYLKNHIGWFLGNHHNGISKFEAEVFEKYGERISVGKNAVEPDQEDLF